MASDEVAFCDIMSGRDPSRRARRLPPHQGPVTLTFNLHNAATRIDEQVAARSPLRPSV
jgi:hypothetical protein